MPELYSLSRLAEELSLDRRTISKRLAAIPPAKENKTAKMYLLADVVKALIAQAVEEVKPKEEEEFEEEEGDAYGREKVRLTRAQADKMELDLAIARQEVIPAVEIEAIWTNIVGAVKAKLNAIPSRASHQIVGLEEPIQVEVVLKKMVDAVLTELADSDPDEYGDDASSARTDTEDA